MTNDPARQAAAPIDERELLFEPKPVGLLDFDGTSITKLGKNSQAEKAGVSLTKKGKPWTWKVPMERAIFSNIRRHRPQAPLSRLFASRSHHTTHAHTPMRHTPDPMLPVPRRCSR